MVDQAVLAESDPASEGRTAFGSLNSKAQIGRAALLSASAQASACNVHARPRRWEGPYGLAMTGPPIPPFDTNRPSKEFQLSREELEKVLQDKRTFFGLEGGVVYSGTFHGQPCLVTDEGTLADFLDEGDDISQLDPRVRIFDDQAHREAYVAERGWGEARGYWREHKLGDLRREIERAWKDGGLEALERDAILACLAAFEGTSVAEDRPSRR
jgi:hypothetical protein